jgi:transcriptional regulator GlxA family with amidase domain
MWNRSQLATMYASLRLASQEHAERPAPPERAFTPSLNAALPADVRRALQLLRANATELGSGALSLEALARAVGSTPRELSRAFRESLGLRPLEVALLLRLDRSLGLLEHTGLPIAEVAALCGFLGAPHYLKVFWSAFSMTPSDYREACTTGRARRLRSTSLAGLIAQRVLETSA